MSAGDRRSRAWTAHAPDPNPGRPVEPPRPPDVPVPPDAEPVIPQRDPPSPNEPRAPVKA